LSVHNALF